jgi:hypothetical protein
MTPDEVPKMPGPPAAEAEPEARWARVNREYMEAAQREAERRRGLIDQPGNLAGPWAR